MRSGALETGQAGEAWLFARYVTRSARLSVVQPFANVTTSTDTQHALDRLWLQRLNQLGLRPGSQAPVTTLARRLYLDLADRLPTPAELQTFRDRPAASRVLTTAQALLKTDDFATKFGRHLAEWVEIPLEPPARPNPRTAIFRQQHQRLVAAVRRGNTLHAIAERLIVADRSLLDRFPDPRDRSELTGRAFLGIRIGCARCHNSPIDKWERKDHLAFSALFADPRPNPMGSMEPGILFDPENGKVVTPRTLPVAGPADTSAQSSGHARTVADFVVKGEHGMFARNMANRTFAALMGKGLVEPIDDHRLSNPAVHESLLAHLAAQVAGGDLRKLVLHIVTSRIYQTGSESSESNADDAAMRFFARRVARTMPPATFANAVSRALGTTPTERLTRSPLARQLALLNSAFLHDAVRDSGWLETLAQFAPDAKARCRDLFLLLLSREPRSEEATAFLSDVSDRNGIADLAFALLAGREFGSIR